MPETPKPYLTYKLDLIKSMATKAADQAYAEELDLRVRELRVLRPVHDHPGISATELRHLLVLDKTLMSKNLAVLEHRGLIRREADAADNRMQRLFLTDEGENAWRIGERLGRAMEAEMFGELSTAQWHELHALLDAVLASFEHWRSRQPSESAERAAKAAKVEMAERVDRTVRRPRREG